MPRKKHPPLLIKTPANLDLDMLLEQYPSGIPNDNDYLLAILSLIYNNGEFTIIRSTRLKKLADNYRELINWLKDRSIITVDETNSKVNKIAKRYKLNSQYQNSLKDAYITTGSIIAKLKPKSESEELEFYDGYKYQSPTWVSSEYMSSVLQLKPKLMIKGLRALGVIREEGFHEDYDENSQRGYYYKHAYKRGRSYPKLMIDSNLFYTIRRLAEEHPNDLPKATKKAPPKL